MYDRNVFIRPKSELLVHGKPSNIMTARAGLLARFGGWIERKYCVERLEEPLLDGGQPCVLVHSAWSPALAGTGWRRCQSHLDDLKLSGRLEELLDDEQAVVLGTALRSRRRSGLDESGVDGDGEIADERVDGLARSVRDDHLQQEVKDTVRCVFMPDRGQSQMMCVEDRGRGSTG
jgi:hypothetical protein